MFASPKLPARSLTINVSALSVVDRLQLTADDDERRHGLVAHLDERLTSGRRAARSVRHSSRHLFPV